MPAVDLAVQVVWARRAGRFAVTRQAAAWLYLGKNLRTRRRLEARLGAERRVWLGDGLHAVARELRQPFLDFVDRVGAAQRDRIAWWSTTFSWKVWGASDLFLLICYLGLAERLVEDAMSRKEPLLIVVEDPWLLRQMRENWAANASVKFHGVPSLAGVKTRAVLLGLVRRAAWAFRVVRHYWRQQRVWPRAALRTPVAPAAAIYTYPQRRALRGATGWADPYLPGLDEIFRDAGCEVIRFSAPECEGLEEELAARARGFRPLILYARAAGFWRSLRAVWWPRWPDRLEVAGSGVRHLAEREWWLDLSHSALCIYRFFYECLRRMLSEGQWRWLAYPYENQPWEKMISICARERNVRTAGIQHSTLSIFYLSYFLGRAEAQHMPLPDVIATAGHYPHALLAEGGVPTERLTLWGTIRYQHLAPANGPAGPRRLASASLSEVLVALPIDIHMSEHLLEAVRTAFPDGGRAAGIRFHVKAHPACPIDVARLDFPALTAPGALEDALRACGLVVFVGSTVGPEALLAGRQVLRYQPELLLNVDPSEVYGDRLPTCSERDLRATVLRCVRERQMGLERLAGEELIGQLFAPFNRDLVAKTLGQ